MPALGTRKRKSAHLPPKMSALGLLARPGAKMRTSSLRQPGRPDFRTRGFASPDCSGFALSEILPVSIQLPVSGPSHSTQLPDRFIPPRNGPFRGSGGEPVSLFVRESRTRFRNRNNASCPKGAIDCSSPWQFGRAPRGQDALGPDFRARQRWPDSSRPTDAPLPKTARAEGVPMLGSSSRRGLFWLWLGASARGKGPLRRHSKEKGATPEDVTPCYSW